MKRPAAAKAVARKAARAAPSKLEDSATEVADCMDWQDEPDAASQQRVFLVTAAAALNATDREGGPPLRDPSLLSKEEFHAALMDCIAKPVYEHKHGGRPPSVTPDLDVYVGVKEPHRTRPQEHHHAVLKFLKTKQGFLPFKLAMRQRHGIATHWSTSHKHTWSAVRYVHCTSPTKSIVDTKPLIWTRDGRPFRLEDECNEPFQAAAWNRAREARGTQPYEKKGG